MINLRFVEFKNVTEFFEKSHGGGVHLTPGAKGVLAEKAGEAVGNFTFLQEGSAREVMFLPGELVHDDGVGTIEFLPVAVFHF